MSPAPAPLREIAYRLRRRTGSTPTQLPFHIVGAHRALAVETRVAHLDDRGHVWRILDVTGSRDALAAARDAFEAYRSPQMVEKQVLGQSGSRLILWYRYRPPRAGGFSHTAFALARLGRATLLTDRTEGDDLVIRLLTPASSKIPGFLRSVERESRRTFDFDLLYVGPPRGLEQTRLTQAEEETLRAALDVGYFEVPRRAGLREVAKRLGVSASAAGYRLRTAEARLARAVTGQGA